MEEERQKRVIMVAIDGSESSNYALDWTLNNLLQTILNSELLIFTVQPIANYSYVFTLEPAPELVKAVGEDQRKTAMALLQNAKDVCSKYGITPNTLTEVGDPKDAIREAVKRENVDLLVLGSHGRGAIKRAFLGSVSNYCVHNVDCPVLVVRKSQ